jgi:hypothetical protein
MQLNDVQSKHDDLYKYIIERCVPEGALEADTIGLDYDELMTIVGEKD